MAVTILSHAVHKLARAAHSLCSSGLFLRHHIAQIVTYPRRRVRSTSRISNMLSQRAIASNNLHTRFCLTTIAKTRTDRLKMVTT